LRSLFTQKSWWTANPQLKIKKSKWIFNPQAVLPFWCNLDSFNDLRIFWPSHLLPHIQNTLTLDHNLFSCHCTVTRYSYVKKKNYRCLVGTSNKFNQISFFFVLYLRLNLRTRGKTIIHLGFDSVKCPNLLYELVIFTRTVFWS